MHGSLTRPQRRQAQPRATAPPHILELPSKHLYKNHSLNLSSRYNHSNICLLLTLLFHSANPLVSNPPNARRPMMPTMQKPVNERNRP